MVNNRKLGMIGKQFKEMKFGDRFFYENGHDPEIRFTPNQLSQIRKASIARIMCNHVALGSIQANPFRIADPITNKFVRCSTIPDLVFDDWKLSC